MSSAAQALSAASPFAPTSRYAGLATETMTGPDGKSIVYLTRRFIPPADQLALLQFYTVVQGDRLDNLAYQFLGDPLAFWRMCDANGAMRPGELTATPGRQLRITLPAGVPLPPNA